MTDFNLASRHKAWASTWDAYDVGTERRYRPCPVCGAMPKSWPVAHPIDNPSNQRLLVVCSPTMHKAAGIPIIGETRYTRELDHGALRYQLGQLETRQNAPESPNDAGVAA